MTPTEEHLDNTSGKIHVFKGGMCAIPAGEGKSALFCTEFSEEVGDAPNSVTNSALIFSQC